MKVRRSLLYEYRNRYLKKSRKERSFPVCLHAKENRILFRMEVNVKLNVYSKRHPRNAQSILHEVCFHETFKSSLSFCLAKENFHTPSDYELRKYPSKSLSRMNELNMELPQYTLLRLYEMMSRWNNINMQKWRI